MTVVVQAHQDFKKWLIGFIAYSITITAINIGLTSLKAQDIGILKMAYGIEFAIFTFIGLGTLCRYRPGNFYLPLWRILILVIGGSFAYFSLTLLGYNNLKSEMIFPVLSFGLIGLSLIALITRYVPEALFKKWLAMDKVAPTPPSPPNRESNYDKP